MSRIYDIELSCGCLLSSYDDIYMPCMKYRCKADEEYFKKSEQRIQYEKKLQRIIGMLKENPNQREEINKGIDRLIYLRGRLFEQNQKQNVPEGVSNSDTLGNTQTASSDNSQDCSGGAQEAAKEDTGDCTLPADLNSYKCGHKTNGTIIMDDNELSMCIYIQWAEEEKNLETKQECFDCYLKKLDGNDS